MLSNNTETATKHFLNNFSPVSVQIICTTDFSTSHLSEAKLTEGILLEPDICKLMLKSASMKGCEWDLDQ